jgi:cytochrome c oxidase assembly factor CtaG
MYSLASTHAGGGMLWTSTEMATVVGFIPIFIQWMRSEERLAVRLDASADRALATVLPATASAGGDDDRQRSAWEATWLARTGSVPSWANDRPDP